MRFIVLSLFDIGQSLLVDCWRTLTCALSLVLSFLTLISRCWWTLACALPLVLSFLILVTPFCRLSRVIQPTTGWGYTFFRTVAAKKLVGLCKQHCLDAVYLGLYNRHQVGVTPFYRQSRVIQPTTGWG